MVGTSPLTTGEVGAVVASVGEAEEVTLVGLVTWVGLTMCDPLPFPPGGGEAVEGTDPAR